MNKKKIISVFLFIIILSLLSTNIKALISTIDTYNINCYTSQNDGTDLYCLKDNYVEVYNNLKILIRNTSIIQIKNETFNNIALNQLKTGSINIITTIGNTTNYYGQTDIVFIGYFNGVTQKYEPLYYENPSNFVNYIYTFKGQHIGEYSIYSGYNEYYYNPQELQDNFIISVNYNNFSIKKIYINEPLNLNGIILKTNRINENTKIYFIREITKQQIQNLNNLEIISSGNYIPFNYKNGWYKNDNTNFIIVKENNNIHYYNSAQNLFNDNGQNIFNTFANCQNIKTLSQLNIIDLDCNNENDCLVGVNYETNKYLLFHLSKTAGCNDITLLNNTQVRQVRYNEQNNRFYITHNNTVKVYSTTPFTNETSTNPICIDSYYLCNNPIYVNNFYYCNIDDVVYCSNGCINNSCSQNPSCQNNCYFEGQGYVNIKGYTGCINQFQFSVCDDYNNDGCLELSNPYTCVAGTYCNINTCSPLNTNIETLSYPAYSITPILTNNSYYDTLNKIIVNNNNGLLISQGLSININNPLNKYYSINCDYKKLLVSNNSNYLSINTNKNYEIIINKPKNNITLIRELSNDTIIINNNSIYFNLIKIFDINAEINYIRLLIYNNNLEFMIELNDLAKSKYYTKPIYLENIYNIITVDNMTIYEFNQPSGFKKMISNELYCSYNNNNCYTIKTYISNYNYGLLNDKDIKVCINNIGASDSADVSDFFDFNISGKSGLFIAILIIGISILFIFIAGNYIGISSSILGILSIIVSILFVGYFSIIGVFPIWLIILLIIIAGFIGVFSIRKIFIGD